MPKRRQPERYLTEAEFDRLPSVSPDPLDLTDPCVNDFIPPNPAEAALMRECRREVARRASKAAQDCELLDELKQWPHSDRAFAVHKAMQEARQNGTGIGATNKDVERWRWKIRSAKKRQSRPT